MQSRIEKVAADVTESLTEKLDKLHRDEVRLQIDQAVSSFGYNNFRAALLRAMANRAKQARDAGSCGVVSRLYQQANHYVGDLQLVKTAFRRSGATGYKPQARSSTENYGSLVLDKQMVQ